MSTPAVSVAIPVRNGAATLPGVLAAVRAQTLDDQTELLVCDSGSTDASVSIAREHGARVLEIAARDFAHGPVRNLLVAQARGAHVALLTQDAEPVDERWLERLLGGFSAGEDVALVYGPYRPRPGAGEQTARELQRWFASLAPGGATRVERLSPHERELSARELFGRRSFFTDANGCVARAAWQRVPFPAVAYAEDHALSLSMLRAGYAKAFVPDAAVWHSHDYAGLAQVRRAFDEWRGLLEVYGWRESADPRSIARRLRGELGAAWRDFDRASLRPAQRVTPLLGLTRHLVLRQLGATLGSNADRLPPALRRVCSLEGRASYLPLADLDAQDVVAAAIWFTDDALGSVGDAGGSAVSLAAERYAGGNRADAGAAQLQRRPAKTPSTGVAGTAMEIPVTQTAPAEVSAARAGGRPPR